MANKKYKAFFDEGITLGKQGIEIYVSHGNKSGGVFRIKQGGIYFKGTNKKYYKGPLPWWKVEKYIKEE